jgi:hypothetical protein
LFFRRGGGLVQIQVHNSAAVRLIGCPHDGIASISIAVVWVHRFSKDYPAEQALIGSGRAQIIAQAEKQSVISAYSIARLWRR